VPWTATQALKTVLISLYLQGDMAAAIHYGSIVGNGKVEAGEPEAGIKYCETAKARIVTGSFVAARHGGRGLRYAPRPYRPPSAWCKIFS
jgi:hypothetical protein